MRLDRILRPPAGAAACVAAALVACGGDPVPATRPITQERQWLPIGRAAVAGRSSAERFGFDSRPASAAAAAAALTWSTPSGWRELPPSSMRAADFRVAGDERAECYLTILGGDGGGLLANVNRWRAQMSLPAIEADELAAAPRAPLLGTEGVLVDFRGDWVGMDGDQVAEDHRLVGLISIDGGRARFLKMTGPTEVLEPEVGAFLALAASFREGDAHGDHHAEHGMEAPASSLTWDAPASWSQAADRPLREVTFRLGEQGEGECYVTVLGGTGGGAFANINRWRNQMGQPDLSAAEFDELLRIPMLGTAGVVVEADGVYRGMGDELVEAAALLGAVCELPGQAVFVKLIGPAELVRSSREAFLSFCESLGPRQ